MERRITYDNGVCPDTIDSPYVVRDGIDNYIAVGVFGKCLH